ncbi:thiamine pyrophosphate-binding protein [Streptomyces hokutonensis]|uniref:Thiamine pyrophosphate-binding protein n=1 Tax=Streptomyces hokutonensis TaxID=1306990 RepID=A0ABW6M5G3_9ACTN
MLSVREVVAGSVASSGVDTVFALMGAANQELMCDMEKRCRIRLVHARHEAGAVGMADGYARFSGRLGVATVTAGPGVTNTATSLAVARAHCSPVLLLAGDIPAGDVRNPQYFEQNSFTRLCAGAGGRVGHRGELAGLLGSAAHALSADLPFALHLPVDVQEKPAETLEVVSLRGPADRGDAAELAETEVAKAIQLLAGARRPVMLAGRGALAARDVLAELAQSLGAPLVTTLRAAGLFAGHPLEAGVAGAMGDGRALRLLESADLVVAVGTSLHPLAASPSAICQGSAVLVRIDTAPPLGAWAYGADLRADTRIGAGRLLRRLAARGFTGPAPSTLGGTSDSWAGPTEDRRTGAGVHPLDALEEMRGLLPEHRLLVIGGGHASLSACQLLPACAPRDFTCVSTDFGAIGQSLPVAIGACFARPGQRVFNVTADGELMMSLAEFHTAVRYRLPLTVVVLNDHGFGQERHNLTRAGRSTYHANHPTPDLVSVAQAMGATGYRVTHPDELVNLRQAFNHQQGVVLVDIHIDPSYLNPASAYVASAMSRRAQQ